MTNLRLPLLSICRGSTGQTLRKADMRHVYAEQRLQDTMDVWVEPFIRLRLQKIFNPYQDPCERADITLNTYLDWSLKR